MYRIISTKSIALILFATIFLSAIFGFGGAYLATCLFIQPAIDTDYNCYPVGGAMALTTSDGQHPDSAETLLSIPEIYALNAESVVEITTETVQSAPFLGQFISSVTNTHVIEGARSITVRLENGESYPATLIGKDNRTDLAVLKIEAANLQPVILGDSSKLTVGELAVAIGNPLGELGGTLTEGIISALDRDIIVEGQSMQLLQTSAAVNPGNSGGGLFNSRGELIGIINAKSAGANIEGLGFAIPANLVAEVVDQLIDFGYVTGRPSLGVRLVDIHDVRTAMYYGVTNTGVYVLEAAEENGLQSGDRLIAIAGRQVDSSSAVREVVDANNVGDIIIVTVLRGNNVLELPITLVESRT